MTEFDSASPLLPYQQRWVMDRSPLKIAEKSRRIGITWATGYEAVDQAMTRDGTDVWYSVMNEDDAREFIDDVADWARALNIVCSSVGETLIEDEEKDILAFRVRFKSGHKVTGLSSNPRRLRGKEGYYIDDESAHNEFLPETMKAVKAFVMWGKGRVALISTHNGTDSYFNKLVEDVRSLRTPGSLHRIPIHAAIEQGLYRRVCQKNGTRWTEEGERKWLEDLFAFYGEDSDEELLCVPRGSGGRYLSRRIIEQCQSAEYRHHRLILEDDFATWEEPDQRAYVQRWCEQTLTVEHSKIPDHADVYLGADFGRWSDLSVLAPLYLDAECVRHVPFLVELGNVPFAQQEQVARFILDPIRDRRRLKGGYLDAGNIGAGLAEALASRYHRTFQAAYLAAGPPREDDKRHDKDGGHLPSVRYSEAMPGLKKDLEERAVVLPKSLDLLADLELFERRDGFPSLPSRRVKGTDRRQRHGDSGVAVMLAHYASLELVNGLTTSGYRGVSPGGRESLHIPTTRSISRASRGVML